MEKRGITLIALVITIIILLILAGITLNMLLGENGIIKKAELAGKKYENEANKEENILQKTDEYIANYRENDDTYTPCNPCLLTYMYMPNSSTSGRAVGTYYANISSFTKSNTEFFNKYFIFKDSSGWEVQKSGYYMIGSKLQAHYKDNYSDALTNLRLNDDKITLNIASPRNKEYVTDVNNTTIYLEKGTIINFEHIISNSAPIYHYVGIKIFALFK